MALFTINGSNSATRGNITYLKDSKSSSRQELKGGLEINGPSAPEEFKPTFYTDMEKTRPLDQRDSNTPNIDVNSKDTNTNKGDSKDSSNVAQKNQKAQAAIAGAKFFANVMNIQSQYNNITAAASSNIFLAHQSANDAISRGKQQALQLETQGRDQGDMAKISAAAQGQDVQGAGVGRLVAGQEAAGIYNAMVAEINASREALGFEQEVIRYQGQIDQAKIQKNMGYFNSALQLGASIAPLG